MEEGRGSIGSINLIRSSEGKDSVVNLSGQVHQLPCCIKYDGPCAVSDYFRPKPTGMHVPFYLHLCTYMYAYYVYLL